MARTQPQIQRLVPEGTQRGLMEEKHTSVQIDFKRQWRNGRDLNTHGEAGKRGSGDIK